MIFNNKLFCETNEIYTIMKILSGFVAAQKTKGKKDQGFES
jgi:hypothetical protein